MMSKIDQNRLVSEQRLVVGDQHLNGDPGHVQPVQEILQCLVQFILGVDMKISVISHVVKSFCHSGNSILNKTDMGRNPTADLTSIPGACGVCW